MIAVDGLDAVGMAAYVRIIDGGQELLTLGFVSLSLECGEKDRNVQKTFGQRFPGQSS